MSKVVLIGVAALFLATGAAHGHDAAVIQKGLQGWEVEIPPPEFDRRGHIGASHAQAARLVQRASDENPRPN